MRQTSSNQPFGHRVGGDVDHFLVFRHVGCVVLFRRADRFMAEHQPNRSHRGAVEQGGFGLLRILTVEQAVEGVTSAGSYNVLQ